MHPENAWILLSSGLLGTRYPQIPRVYCILLYKTVTGTQKNSLSLYKNRVFFLIIPSRFHTLYFVYIGWIFFIQNAWNQNPIRFQSFLDFGIFAYFISWAFAIQKSKIWKPATERRVNNNILNWHSSLEFGLWKIQRIQKH
jgi:hypothetical protein